MKKRAVLYLRVSTTEQKEKGFSIRDQEARLQAECAKRGYEVVLVITEDFSAKSFTNRPEWQKFVKDIKTKKLQCDILFCLKPDRFSRNLQESLTQKAWLEKNDILLKYLEGGVNPEDPNSILLEAIGYAIPQVENMQKSLTVTSGMRQAMKEGKYVNRAPFGYKTIDGIITPDENANFVISAFKEVSKGLEAPEVIRKKLLREGFKGCERNNFHKILRNKLYCGLVFIKRYKNEQEITVKGIHQPLISEDLFQKVQEILICRGRKSKKYSKISDSTPLRGLLYCDECKDNLTSSTSLNKIKKPYTYYHCQKGCTRVSSVSAEHQIIELLASIELPKEVLNLYFKIMKEILKDDDIQIKRKVDGYHELIEKSKIRVNYIEDQYADGKLEYEGYRSMKERFEDDINTNQRKITTLGTVTSDFKRYMDYALYLISDISKYYQAAHPQIKAKIVCSIFPEKVPFFYKTNRTPKINQTIEFITQGNSELTQKKRRLENIKSPSVARRGIEPLFPE